MLRISHRKPGDFTGPVFNSSITRRWEKEFPGFSKLLALICNRMKGIPLKPLVHGYGVGLFGWKPTNTQEGPFSNGLEKKVTWSLFVISTKKRGLLWRRHEVFTARRVPFQARELEGKAKFSWWKKPRPVHNGDSIATALERMSRRKLSQVTVLALVAYEQFFPRNGLSRRASERMDITLIETPSDYSVFRVLLGLARESS